mgnify:CR=1 FL=1
MAEGNGGGRAGISAGQAIAQRGDLCLERSDTQVGDFYPKQYRRGTIKEFEQRVYEVPIHSQRFCCGTGNTTAACCQNRLFIGSGHLADHRVDNGGCQDYQYSSLQTNH